MDECTHIIKTITAEMSNGHVVLFDSVDLIDWLRCQHELTDAELVFCNEIAEKLQFLALEALARDVDHRLES